jgi:uncharacterized damage-inducible protein DinB
MYRTDFFYLYSEPTFQPMSLKSAVVAEFELRVFSESYVRIYRCLNMISDDELWKQPASGIPSIGNLVLHICGNARQWVLSGLGDKEDNRDRDQEFVPRQKIKKAELVFLMENLKMNIRQVLKDLKEKDLAAQRNIQGFEVTGFSALVHVLEHFSYHTGQITMLTKLWTGKDTGYYAGMNLNKQNGKY